MMGVSLQAGAVPGGMRAGVGCWFAAFLSGLALIGLDLADGVSFVRDIDDRMREIQIRDLLADGNWYDLTLPMVQMPEAYVSPWSRLVDLPYVAIELLLEPLLGAEPALAVSFLLWPVVLLGLFIGFTLATMGNMMPGGAGLRVPHVVAATVLMSIAVLEFSPGRIDHHNVQLVLMMAMLAGVSGWSARGGLLAGVAASLSIAVGLECLPFVAVMFGGLVVATLARLAGSRAVLRAAGLSMLCATVPLAVLLIGPGLLAASACDAFAMPAVVAMLASSALLVLAATLFGERSSIVFQILALSGGGIAILTGLDLLFPHCAAGPYGVIDPLSRSLWLGRLVQEQGISAFFAQGATGPAALVAVLGCLLLLAVPAMAGFLRPLRPGPLVVVLMVPAALVMTLLLTRYIRFPAAFVPLLLPLVLSFHGAPGRSRRLRLLSLGVPPLLAAVAFAGLYVAFPARETVPDAADLIAGDDCVGERAPDLAGLAPGRILVPLGIGVSLATHLPAESGFSVAAIPFHRASPGIRRSFTAFLTASADERREALQAFDYLAVCLLPFPVASADGPLYSALATGRAWPGLSPIARQADSRLQFFSIDHPALR